MLHRIEATVIRKLHLVLLHIWEEKILKIIYLIRERGLI